MRRPITIISAISSLLFLIAIVWFGAGIFIDKKDGEERAGRRYEVLLAATKENFSKNQYGTTEFANNFIRAIGNIDDFSSLKLEINGETVYSYPPGHFSIPSPDLVKSYTETIYANDKSLTLKASIYLMKPGSVYKYSRLAVIIILVGIAIVGIFILKSGNSEETSALAQSSRPRRQEYNSFSDYAGEREYAQDSGEEDDEESEIGADEEELGEETSFTDADETESHGNESEISGEEPEADDDEEPVPDSEDDDAQSDSSLQEDEEISINFPEETAVPDDEDDSERSDEEIFSAQSGDDEEADDGGLDIIDQMEQENEQDSVFGEEFTDSEEETSDSEEQKNQEPGENVSPITNLKLQASLESEFDEIIQSGALHATLVLLKINGLDRGNSISQSVIAILKDTNPSAHIFEYRSDAYALVLADSDLQTTVDNFEQIYNKVADYLKSNNAANEVSVGISSASGRNVNAERVILEANQALDYASQDPDSPIVAFRANPAASAQ